MFEAIWKQFEKWEEDFRRFNSIPWYIVGSIVVVVIAFVFAAGTAKKGMSFTHGYVVLSSLFAILTAGVAGLCFLFKDHTLDIIAVGVSYLTGLLTAIVLLVLLIIVIPWQMALFVLTPCGIITTIYLVVKRRK